MLRKTLPLLGLLLIAPAWAAIDDEGSARVPLLAASSPRSSADAPRAIPGFDDATGRDTRHFAPDRIVDFRHMKLEIDIPDMNRPHLSAIQTLSFTPIARRISELRLDAHLLDIKKV